MENLKSTQLGNSYWAETGIYQKEYSELYNKFIKPSGKCDTLHGELIRSISRLFYEYCNNGNCNACSVESTTEYVTCVSCGGQGCFQGDDELEDCNECFGEGQIEEDVDGETSVNEFYANFLGLIYDSIPEARKAVDEVENLITQNLYSSKNQFSDDNMQLYNNLCDIVIHYVLNSEDKQIPESYKND